MVACAAALLLAAPITVNLGVHADGSAGTEPQSDAVARNGTLFCPPWCSTIDVSIVAPSSWQRFTKSRIVQKWMFGVSYQE